MQIDKLDKPWAETRGDVTEATNLTVTFIDRWTKGTVTTRLSQENIFQPETKLDFTRVEAYVDVRLQMSNVSTYSINLFTSQPPNGLVFFGNLVFSLSDDIDFMGGF